jgi:aryl-alcohol dehydrogenase-like predicted oxidoreductase
MDDRPLGDTGLTVSQLCLGAMMFGAFGNGDHADCIRLVHRTLDAGITFIDTADGYSDGESEEILGKALQRGRRDRVVLAVKFGGPLAGNPQTGASPQWITEAVEGSLSRLRTDVIDLYQIGVPDPRIAIEDTISALSDLVDAGKIRTFGASKVPASQIVEGQWAAERLGRERIATEQPPYSMLTRAIEYDVLPTCQRYDMGVLAYSPLARGWLTGKYHGASRFDVTDQANAAKVDAVEALSALAEEADLSLIQLAIAFAVQHPAVTSTIIGPRTLEHLDGYLAADGIDLTDDVLDRIDLIVPPGTTVDGADNMWAVGTRALDPSSRRRG